MKYSEKGMALSSLIFVLAVIGFVLYLGIELFPMYQGYYAVRSSMKGLLDEANTADADPSQLKEMFFRRLSINSIDDVKSNNVKFDRIEGGWRMSVNYEVRRSLIGNLDVVGKFSLDENLVKHTSNAP